MKVSNELLLQELGFPTSTTLLHVEAKPASYTVDLIVAHPDLPDSPEGAVLPQAQPTFRREMDGVVLIDWGVVM